MLQNLVGIAHNDCAGCHFISLQYLFHVGLPFAHAQKPCARPMDQGTDGGTKRLKHFFGLVEATMEGCIEKLLVAIFLKEFVPHVIQLKKWHVRWHAHESNNCKAAKQCSAHLPLHQWWTFDLWLLLCPHHQGKESQEFDAMMSFLKPVAIGVSSSC